MAFKSYADLNGKQSEKTKDDDGSFFSKLSEGVNITKAVKFKGDNISVQMSDRAEANLSYSWNPSTLRPSARIAVTIKL